MISKNCLVCSKEYFTKPSKKDSKFCSRICRDKSNTAKPPYNKNNSLLQAFEKNLIRTNACWDWKIKPKGQITVTYDGKTISAKRASWILYKGKLQNLETIISTCRNKFCTSPDHLILKRPCNSLIESYEKYVVKKFNSCWEWLKVGDVNGYGMLNYRGKILKAHRVSYSIHIGEIPKNLLVLHKCDNPPCTNPDHLFLGSHLDNMKDMDNKNRRKKKLNLETIKEIKELIVKNISIIEIAKKYNVSESTISRIRNNKSYFIKYKEIEI